MLQKQPDKVKKAEKVCCTCGSAIAAVASNRMKDSIVLLAGMYTKSCTPLGSFGGFRNFRRSVRSIGK